MVGRTCRLAALAMHGRRARRARLERHDALPRDDADPYDRRHDGSADSASRATLDVASPRSCATHVPRGRLPGRVRDLPDPEPGRLRYAAARAALRRDRLHAAKMRIVVDVSPLSHQRTGVGNYVRGSLAGLVEAAAGEHELVAFAPASARGRREIESALAGLDVERRLPVVPAAHALRTAWSRAGTPPAERFLGGFDVFHFRHWMYPPQRAGVRSTMVHDLLALRFPQWVHGP